MRRHIRLFSQEDSARVKSYIDSRTVIIHRRRGVMCETSFFDQPSHYSSICGSHSVLAKYVTASMVLVWMYDNVFILDFFRQLDSENVISVVFFVFIYFLKWLKPVIYWIWVQCFPQKMS